MRSAKWLLALVSLSVASAACIDSDDDDELEATGRTGDELVEGKRVVDGDIVVEPEDEAPILEPTLGPQLYARQAKSLYWPKGIVPYTIASSVSATHRSRITASIKEWQAKTAIRWVPRKAEAAYVTFTEPVNNNICSADLGHIAGTRRWVYLRDSARNGTCNLGVVVHEMGHTVGLVHEHQRPDRDQYVKITSSCIPTGLSGAFAFTTTPSKTVGPYDIASTMHYRSTTLTKPGCGGYSITAKNGTALLHDWATLSAGDVAGVAMLYGAAPPKPAADAGAADAGAPDASPNVETPPPPPEAPTTPEEPADEDTNDIRPIAARPAAAESGGCSATPANEGRDALAFAFVNFVIALIAAARARWYRRRSCKPRSEDRT